jgi:peptide/nickel transport system permease protein
MVAYIVRRLLMAIIVLLVVSFISFMLIQLIPGDPATTILGLNATPAQISALRHELWLDKPVLVQYGHWIGNVFKGDFGQSLSYHENITSLIAARLPITLYLSLLAFILATVLGIIAGIVCAVTRGSTLDQTISILANMGVAIPIFWLGILGIYFLGLKLGWLPIQGYTSPVQNFVLSVKQSVMPVICLAIVNLAMITRQTRSSMLEVIQQDYIRTARSKGLMKPMIMRQHALKNALIPIVTLLGLEVPYLIGGSVIVETVFNIPGMGRLLVNAVFNKDYVIIQAGVLVIGIVVALANLVVDISYGWLDPRIRHQ